DYYAQGWKNPLKYFWKHHRRPPGKPMDWEPLRDGMAAAGWVDLTNRRSALTVNGLRIAFAGVDDPHLKRDRYSQVAGPADPDADLRVPWCTRRSRGWWTGSPTTGTTWCSPATPTAASSGCRSTARW